MATGANDVVIAIAQVAGKPDVNANFDAVAHLVAEAVAAGARLVAFPEAVMFDFTASAERISASAWADAERFKAAIRDLAVTHRIAIVTGAGSDPRRWPVEGTQDAPGLARRTAPVKQEPVA